MRGEALFIHTARSPVNPVSHSLLSLYRLGPYLFPVLACFAHCVIHISVDNCNLCVLVFFFVHARCEVKVSQVCIIIVTIIIIILI